MDNINENSAGIVIEICEDACERTHAEDDSRKKHVPSDEKLYDLADFFKIFADSTRVKILYALLYNSMCVCEIADMLGLTQSAVSHQLRVLKQTSLVKNRREGKNVIYELADGHISGILSLGLEHIEE